MVRSVPERRSGPALGCRVVRKEAFHLAEVDAQARHKDLRGWSQDKADLVGEWLALHAPRSPRMKPSGLTTNGLPLRKFALREV